MIVHHGGDFVVVDKPAGIFVHKTQLDATKPDLLTRLSKQFGHPLHAVHRLDRSVSGLLVFAFHSAATKRLQAAMQDPSAIKEYVALVRGRCANEFVCNEPLKGPDGKMREARTEYRCLRRFPWCSLVAIRIRTGRRHQIRRHCDRVQHHILGDTTHGKSRLNAFYRERYGLDRIYLHARRLSLPSEGLDLRSHLPRRLAEVAVALDADARSLREGDTSTA
ncbi:MAG: RNA pseudouridine synthase [Planctomycetes bacterium]|nr:RNA pseudouridine synthase [Planctomycetota bacterium]